MDKRFITIDTEKWTNSVYVPQSNGKISTDKGYDGRETACWYVDSRGGRWSTLMASFDGFSEGDEAELLFWVKYRGNPQTFNAEIMHDNYEKRTTYNLSASSSYCVGSEGGCRLFRIVHRATENKPLTIAVSSNCVEMTFFPAEEDAVGLITARPREKGMISKLHPVVTLMNGENYGFCGCMAYLADCLGMDGSVYNFQYFAMATGDIFTQIHCDNLCDCTDCVSDYLFANDIVYKAFCGLGYLYEYLDAEMIKSDREGVMRKIRASIDGDIPVISAGFEGDGGYDFCVICGYTDDGKLKIMFKENNEPIIQENILEVTRGLVFAGEFRHDINLRQQFANVTKNIYGCVTRKAERGCTFGAEAFAAWAESLVNGGIAEAEIVDGWCSFGYNLCIAGTNGYAGSPMLRDILKSCPDFEQTKAFTILKPVCEQFDIQNKIFGELMQMGFGFDISEEKLRDREFMRPAAEKIKEFCKVCEDIAALYTEEILSDDDFWCTDDYRIVRCYKQPFPKCRFVGKCYKDSDRVDGMFNKCWSEFHEAGHFAVLEKLLTDEFRAAYEDWGAYVALMKSRYQAPDDYFEYWIGMFLPEDCEVPEGFGYIDLEYDCAGICWIKGHEWNVYCHEGDCYERLTAKGMSVPSVPDGGCYSFERYCCPRFTTPDKYNEVTLDIGFFVEKGNAVKDISELRATAEGEADKPEYFSLPDARVIGLSMRCPLDMKAANPIPAFWGKCAEDGLFETVGELPKLIPAMLGFTDDYDEKTNTFLYITGVLCPKDTPVPEGYTYRDIPATVVSKSRYGEWLGECRPIWDNDGYEWSGDEGQFWNAELYIDGEDNDHGFRLLCAVRKKKTQENEG